MKKVLVTGAAGFIGSYCTREFAARGWHVCALQHRARVTPFDAAPGRLDVLDGDVSDEASLTAVFKTSGPFDAVVHCAGRASDVGRRAEFRRANFEPVRHLARLARSGAIGRIIFISTTDVYGLRDFAAAADEDTQLDDNLNNPYPFYKIEAEKLLRHELTPERYSIVRPAAVWGIGDHTFAPRILGFLRMTPWIIHFGKLRGNNRWPLAHVRNVAAAAGLCATEPTAAGLAVNVIDSERTTADEFYRLLASVYLPGRSFASVSLPFVAGQTLGTAITALSNLLNLDHPFMDPSLYALYAANCNLDFDNARLKSLLAAAGRRLVTRDEGLAELRSVAVSHTGTQPS